MYAIDFVDCPECGDKKADKESENGIVVAVYCQKCGYSFACKAKNQGDDGEAWDAYPDGWTCQDCGEVYAGIMPASTDDGTICLKCDTKVKE